MTKFIEVTLHKDHTPASIPVDKIIYFGPIPEMDQLAEGKTLIFLINGMRLGVSEDYYTVRGVVDITINDSRGIIT